MPYLMLEAKRIQKKNNEAFVFAISSAWIVVPPNLCMASSSLSSRSQLNLTPSSPSPRPSLCLPSSSAPPVLQPTSSISPGFTFFIGSLSRIIAYIYLLLSTFCLSSLRYKLHKSRKLFCVIHHYMPSA